jgi:hypothetical protein
LGGAQQILPGLEFDHDSGWLDRHGPAHLAIHLPGSGGGAGIYSAPLGGGQGRRIHHGNQDNPRDFRIAEARRRVGWGDFPVLAINHEGD